MADEVAQYTLDLGIQDPLIRRSMLKVNREEFISSIFKLHQK